MVRRVWSATIFAATAIITSAAAVAQQPTPSGPRVAQSELMEQLRLQGIRARALPDTPGTGPFPSIKEEVASLPDHVVYRPADLSRVGRGKLGIVAWGNGGCQADGASSRLHLAQIASHGYLAIANGRILSGPGAPPRAPEPQPAPGVRRTLPPPATSAQQLTQAIDWAIAENKRRGSPYFGKLDTSAIAVAGWSCGGLQALQIAASDPRVKTAVIHNSGIHGADSSVPPIPGMTIGKDILDRLHAPILYVLGGPSDIAYLNGMDDFARITKVPALVANLRDAGHGGSFYAANGGKAATIAVAWLNWQLKSDTKGARMFTGPKCGLCSDPDWKIEKKMIR